MNTTPKGSAGIALLLLAAARAARPSPGTPPIPAPVRPAMLGGTVGRIAAAYPSRISDWRRVA